MHLPSHELDERLRDLRNMRKSYLGDSRSSPYPPSPCSDYFHLPEDYRDFVFPGSCPRLCPYANPIRSSKHEKHIPTYEGTGRESSSTPFPKDSAITNSPPSTLSNKSSAAFSNGDDTPSKYNRKRKKNIKTERTCGSKATTSYFYSQPLYRSGSPCLREDLESDEGYGPSWLENHPPKHLHGQWSLPCSPAHRRQTKNATMDKHRR